MRTLHFARWYPNMDDPQLGVFVHKHLRAIAHQHEVVMVYVGSVNSRKIDGFAVEKIQKDKLTIITVQYNAILKSVPGFGKLLNWRKYVKGLRLGVEQIEDPVFDLVHAHVLLRSAHFAYKTAKRLNIPFVLSEHWHGFINGEFEKRSWLWKRMAKKILKEADVVQVVSNPLKRFLQDEGLVDRCRIKVIPNVVDRLTGQVTKLSTKDKKLHILTVADLDDSIKNISGTINTLKRLKKKEVDFVFHLVGDGPDQSKLIDLGEGSLGDSFKYYGRLTNDQVLPLIQQMDVTVVNSYQETFSVFAAESIMHQVPVVCTRCGGPETFLTKECAIMIGVDRSDELEKALMEVLENKTKYILEDPSSLGFSAKSIGQQFDRLYRCVSSNYLQTSCS